MRELGIGFVAYSPLGRGVLAGRFRTPEDLAPDDWRRQSPRFQSENFTRNLDVVSQINALAQEKRCTPSQLALAWLLTPADLARIDAVAPRGVAAGERYHPNMMGLLNG